MENRSATICICKGAGKLDFLFCLLYNKSIYPLAAAILFDTLLPRTEKGGGNRFENQIFMADLWDRISFGGAAAGVSTAVFDGQYRILHRWRHHLLDDPRNFVCRNGNFGRGVADREETPKAIYADQKHSKRRDQRAIGCRSGMLLHLGDYAPCCSQRPQHFVGRGLAVCGNHSVLCRCGCRHCVDSQRCQLVPREESVAVDSDGRHSAADLDGDFAVHPNGAVYRKLHYAEQYRAALRYHHVGIHGAVCL